MDLKADKYEKTFEIIYSLPGTYTAILTVTDERGGYSTWQVDVIVSDSGGDNLPQDGEDDSYSTVTLIGAAAVAIAGLVGGAMALTGMRGGGYESEDMLEDVEPGGMEEALSVLTGVAEKFPKEWMIPYNMACYLCQLERLAEAKPNLARALEIGGKGIRTAALSDEDLKPLWLWVKNLD